MKLNAAMILATLILLTACSPNQPQKPANTHAAKSAQPSTDLCLSAGPQTPRDITDPTGLNTSTFEMSPSSTEMNLCNVHTHTNAEHSGPGFNVFVSSEVHGGYACNEADSLSESELADPFEGRGAFKGVKPGDSIEVHWVHSSCDVSPGEGLGACLTDECTDPFLRVEAQVFLVVNDINSFDFTDFDYAGAPIVGEFHQPKSLPTGSGNPVVFRGSTTGPSYDQSSCSPAQVTWSVRPQCMKVDIASLHKWAEQGNLFNETKSHGVRQLVTAPELLAPIE